MSNSTANKQLTDTANKSKKTRSNEGLRINISLKGLYAKWAREIKELGLATSNHDLVNQGVKALYENLTNQRIRLARLKTLERAEEEQ